MKVTKAIEAFIGSREYSIKIYNSNLETQVNIRTDLGTRVINTAKSGRKWVGYQDDDFLWKPFRIPWRANTDNPEYIDHELSWPLDTYAEGIGCTGWDFVNKKSRWVGFDFDSLTNHNAGLTEAELSELVDKVKAVDWITIYTSKSGKGIHLYVFIENSPVIKNHVEHAALARAVLSTLSGLLGIRFEDKVDCIGQVLWIWHRDTKEGGLKLVKQGTNLRQVPQNWREHIEPVQSRRKKRYIPPKFIKDRKEFEDVNFKEYKVSLEEEHRKLLAWFAKQDTTWWWDSDYDMLVCHTVDLARAHDELHLRGIFRTNSRGRNVPHDQNCFAFPIPQGGWSVRRHHKGTTENDYWTRDDSGWTSCYYNIYPDFDTACRIVGGTKSSTGQYSFVSGWDAIQAAELLEFEFTRKDETDEFFSRPAYLKKLKSKDLSLRIERIDGDPTSLAGWFPIRTPKCWETVKPYRHEKVELSAPDDLIRHVIRGGQEDGWYLFTGERWIKENRTNIMSSMAARGISKQDAEVLLGQAVYNHWDITTIPFEGEYPGRRRWNVRAPQLGFEPQFGDHTTWDKILQHVGKGLDQGVKNSDWCTQSSILTGAEYLMYWCASMLRYPNQPLPYLFLYGPQDCGKSTLHEALSLLFKNQLGYIQADTAITSQQGFCGELLGAVLCVVEEINIAKVKMAYDRIKDWTTSRTLTIHPKGKDPFVVPNYTHWIQCANSSSYCPILPGDTRINTCPVDMPDKTIPKVQLLDELQEQAPGFLYTLMSLEIPEPESRLRIPCLVSEIKQEIEQFNRNPVEVFLEEECEYTPGTVLKYSDFLQEFLTWLPSGERRNWNSRNVGRMIPAQYPRAKYGGSGTFHIGNITLSADHMVACKVLGSSPIGKKDGKLLLL